VRPVPAVVGQHGGTQQLGQLAGSQAALQVHLEEPLLGVDKAQAPGQVEPAGAAEDGHAPGVALDAEGRPQPGQAALAIHLGQARHQPPAQPQAPRRGGQHQGRQ
jgi:hypothetical protein